MSAPVLHLIKLLSDLLLSAGSVFSLLSLTSALIISTVWLLARRRRSGPLRWKVLARALLPHRIWSHASTRADIGFLLLNVFATSLLIGWALVSGSAVARYVVDGLSAVFGPSTIGLPSWLAATIMTVAAFLAYDFAYWFDHWLKHKVTFLWAFHRVHHTAEVLTPITAYRMHPVDSLIFANICAVVIGTVEGVARFGLGGSAAAWSLDGTNLIMIAFLYTTIHLQHSHIRIAFTGWVGRLLFSPAHHHIHHSSDPKHYDCNLGSCLAVWDWMFGTLQLPDPKARLTFGAAGEEDVHSATGSLIYPFWLALKPLVYKGVWGLRPQVFPNSIKKPAP